MATTLLRFSCSSSSSSSISISITSGSSSSSCSRRSTLLLQRRRRTSQTFFGSRLAAANTASANATASANIANITNTAPSYQSSNAPCHYSTNIQHLVRIVPAPALTFNSNSSFTNSSYRFFATNTATSTATTIDDIDSQQKSAVSSVPPVPLSSPSSSSSSSSVPRSNNKKVELEDLDPSRVMEDIVLASQVNQGNDNNNNSHHNNHNHHNPHNQDKNRNGRKSTAWDPNFCRQAVARYGKHLEHMAANTNTNEIENDRDETTTITDDDNTISTMLLPLMNELVSSEITCRAIRAMLRCNLPTKQLSQRVRQLERLIGTIGQTLLTDQLSLHLLQANGLAGNVGRTLALLQLRKSRNYEPIHGSTKEFTWAVQAITSAALEMRTNRNVYKSEGELSSGSGSGSGNATSTNASLDNPTRFLDAILINMHQRGVQLDIDLATTMLETYACTGRTGKALHFHYKVSLPYDELAKQQKQQQQQASQTGGGGGGIDEGDTASSISRRRRRSVRLKWNAPAPYYKIPSEITNDQLLALPGSSDRRTKSDHELTDSWSLPLTAAFAFCDSLTHGACGHEALTLNLPAYNAMIKVCCYRGALWRAMDILHKTIPEAGLEANTISYLRVLEALARVGDTKTMSSLFNEMVQKDAVLLLNRQVIASMVNGMLNTGNIAGSVSFIQDVFNQYNILPPYTTHLKLLEMALASTGNDKTTDDEPYEAKRHVYFLQQLWRWEPNNPYHSKSLRNQVATTKVHRKLSKAALQDMFAYFGHELAEDDFFDEFQDNIPGIDKEEEEGV